MKQNNIGRNLQRVIDSIEKDKEDLTPDDIHLKKIGVSIQENYKMLKSIVNELLNNHNISFKKGNISGNIEGKVTEVYALMTKKIPYNFYETLEVDYTLFDGTSSGVTMFQARTRILKEIEFLRGQDELYAVSIIELIDMKNNNLKSYFGRDEFWFENIITLKNLGVVREILEDLIYLNLLLYTLCYTKVMVFDRITIPINGYDILPMEAVFLKPNNNTYKAVTRKLNKTLKKINSVKEEDTILSKLLNKKITLEI